MTRDFLPCRLSSGNNSWSSCGVSEIESSLVFTSEGSAESHLIGTEANALISQNVHYWYITHHHTYICLACAYMEDAQSPCTAAMGKTQSM